MFTDNRQISAYLQPQPPKEHEKQLLSIIQRDSPAFVGRLLDIGCATGSFIATMSSVHPDAEYVGIDISETLVELARQRLAGRKAALLVADTLQYRPPAPFDAIVASGVLSIFEDFEPVLDKWLSWLQEQGRLYIFGRFNSKKMDTIVRFRNHHTGGGWESGLTSYSVFTVGRYLEQRGFQYSFQRFYLNIEIPENEDPIRTWTVRCADGKILVINGANVIAEQYFLTIHKAK